MRNAPPDISKLNPSTWKVQYFLLDNGEAYYRCIARNGKTLFHSENQENRNACKQMAYAISVAFGCGFEVKGAK